MKNILCIVKSYADKVRGGGETYLHFFLKELNNKFPNVNLEVLIPNQKTITHTKFEGINIHTTNEPNYLGYIDKCDILITQLDESVKTLRYGLSKEKECILIIHNHLNFHFEFTKNPKVFIIYNCYDMFIRFSNAGNTNDNHFILNPYCDFPKYSLSVNSNDRDYITFINPIRRKGADLVLNCAKYFPKKKFMIVKGGYYHDKAIKYIEEFRKLPNCFVVDNVKSNEMIKIYNKSRIILQPSRDHETYGMVCVEAISSGVPVILSKMRWAWGNMGKLGLYCYVPRNTGSDDEDDATIKECYELFNCIKLLDEPATYSLWRQFYFDRALEKYEEERTQMDEFINIFKNKFLNISIE